MFFALSQSPSCANLAVQQMNQKDHTEKQAQPAAQCDPTLGWAVCKVITTSYIPVIYNITGFIRWGIDVLFPQFDECEKTGTAPLNKRYVNHGQCHLVPAPLCCGPGRAQVQFSTPKSSVDPGPMKRSRLAGLLRGYVISQFSITWLVVWNMFYYP